MPERKRILVTGGAGFIGSHLVDQLLEAGYPVTILDNFSTGKMENLFDAKKKGNLRIIEGSILDFSDIELAMEGCEVVYHLAVECVRRSLAYPLENHHTNATGTLNVLEIARRRKIQRFVYCSSSEVYGNCSDKLLSEKTTVCEPTTVYGAAKLSGEYYTKAYFRTYQLPTVIVRPFNAYGPRAHDRGQRAEVIPRFIIRLLNELPPMVFGDGSSARDFTYVTEVAQGLRCVMDCDALIGREVNMAFGQAITIKEVAERLITVCEKPHLAPVYLESRPGDVYHLHADTVLASQLLGFKPSIHFNDGLIRYLNWFKATYTNVAALLEQEVVNWQMPGG